MENTYKNEMQRIASKIREVREQKKHTQDFVASQIGISQNAYSKIELGYSKITIDRLFHLSTILEVDVADLLGIAPKNSAK